MMTAPLRHISPGDVLPTAASIHNAFVDAANAHRATQYRLRGTNSGHGMPPDTVLVRNDTGAKLAAHSIVGLDEVLKTPVNTPGVHYWINNAPPPVISAVKPLVPQHCFRFGVTTEPLQAGAIGRAWVSGVRWVVLGGNANTPKHYAAILNNITAYLGERPYGVPVVGRTATPLTGFSWAAVDLGRLHHPILRGTLSKQWKFGDTTCDMIIDGDDPQLDGLYGIRNFLDTTSPPYPNGHPSGTKVIVAWNELDGYYNVVAIDQ